MSDPHDQIFESMLRGSSGTDAPDPHEAVMRSAMEASARPRAPTPSAPAQPKQTRMGSFLNEVDRATNWMQAGHVAARDSLAGMADSAYRFMGGEGSPVSDFNNSLPKPDVRTDTRIDRATAGVGKVAGEVAAGVGASALPLGALGRVGAGMQRFNQAAGTFLKNASTLGFGVQQTGKTALLRALQHAGQGAVGGAVANASTDLENWQSAGAIGALTGGAVPMVSRPAGTLFEAMKARMASNAPAAAQQTIQRMVTNPDARANALRMMAARHQTGANAVQSTGDKTLAGLDAHLRQPGFRLAHRDLANQRDAVMAANNIRRIEFARKAADETAKRRSAQYNRFSTKLDAKVDGVMLPDTSVKQMSDELSALANRPGRSDNAQRIVLDELSAIGDHPSFKHLHGRLVELRKLSRKGLDSTGKVVDEGLIAEGKMAGDVAKVIEKQLKSVPEGGKLLSQMDRAYAAASTEKRALDAIAEVYRKSTRSEGLVTMLDDGTAAPTTSKQLRTAINQALEKHLKVDRRTTKATQRKVAAARKLLERVRDDDDVARAYAELARSASRYTDEALEESLPPGLRLIATRGYDDVGHSFLERGVEQLHHSVGLNSRGKAQRQVFESMGDILRNPALLQRTLSGPQVRTLPNAPLGINPPPGSGEYMLRGAYGIDPDREMR